MNNRKLAIAYVKFLLVLSSLGWIRFLLMMAFVFAGAVIAVTAAAHGYFLASLGVWAFTVISPTLLHKWMDELHLLTQQWLWRNNV